MSARKNKIWRYFQKTSDGADCKACKKSLKTKDGNTSGLHRHLEKKHSHDYVEYSEKTDDSLLPPPKKKQRTMVEMLETKSKYDKVNSIQKQFDSAMLDYFCIDLASFSAVEGICFKKLFDIANPKLSLHRRTTYSRKLSIRSREVQAGMKSIITEITPNLKSAAFTSDLWTSRAQDSYISWTFHAIDENWRLHHWTPHVQQFPGRHTGILIDGKLDSFLEELNLPADLPMYCVNDQARNMKLAVKLSKRLDQYLCNNHILQCEVRDSFGMTAGIDDVLQTCKDLASLTHHLTVAAELLESESDAQGINFRQLRQFVDARWNSDLDCMASTDGKNGYGVLYAKNLKSCIEKRIPFCHTGNLFSGAANYLNPALKRLHLKLFKKFQTTKEWLVSQVKDNVEAQPVARVLSADLSLNSKLKRKLNVRLETQEPTSELNPILSEMCQYEYLPDAKKDFPILDLWKLHSNTLPELSSLARQILDIPASSTKLERVFSSNGNVIRSSRHNLHPEKVEQIILIKKNIVKNFYTI
ncbi:E3 SUMO-protein ligase ZBED1-like [Hydra vulgaris]|uniref:E3 SUMO-protein ligase ZBED1-like n=1 Tax=Hydra vulgaris TaxID=6087 RepID=A0ABM4B188_HYDVU